MTSAAGRFPFQHGSGFHLHFVCFLAAAFSLAQLFLPSVLPTPFINMRRHGDWQVELYNIIQVLWKNVLAVDECKVKSVTSGKIHGLNCISLTLDKSSMHYLELFDQLQQ